MPSQTDTLAPPTPVYPMVATEKEKTKCTDRPAEPLIHYTSGLSAFHPSHAVRATVEEHARMLTTQQLSGTNRSSPTSFFVLDLNHVATKLETWERHLGNVQPFFAVKANPSTALIRELVERGGVGFDCASVGEIEATLSLGAQPDEIIFAHPCKTPHSLTFARNANVTQSVFDSACELQKVAKYHPELRLLLRIWVDDRDAQCPLSNKYGAENGEWRNLFQTASKLGVCVNGISLHVGSGITEGSVFSRALGDALKAFRLGQSMGHSMDMLDIGGGFPATCDEHTSLKGISEVIQAKLQEFPSNTKFIAEPGRFVCAEAQTLVSMVIGATCRRGKPCVYIADGLYGSFNCIVFDHSRLVPSPMHPCDVPTHTTVLFGQTCDGFDQISDDVILPKKMDVGDWLAFPAMGAYTNAACSKFNGFDFAPVILVGHSPSDPNCCMQP